MIELSKRACAAELKRFRANGNVWIAADEMPAGIDVPVAWRELLPPRTMYVFADR